MRQDLTVLLRAWKAGDESALTALMPLVYQELHRLAQRYMARERTGHPLQTTALVNEVYLRLIDVKNVDWQDRNHFYALCARLMRRILVDYARTQNVQKRDGRFPHIELEEALGVAAETRPDLDAVDEALTKLSAIDTRMGTIVELRFFGGFTVEEIASVIDVSPETVARDWRLGQGLAGARTRRRPENMTPERWRLVERLYHCACELPAVDRSAYLERACSADPSLKVEVLTLLDSSDPAHSFLDTPAIHLVAQSIASSESTVTGTFAPGTLLSHYRIQEAIGRGGMGVVYKAEDIRLERLVALKVLPDLLARDEQALRRFESEARAASALNHPNICTVYEIDQAGDQRFIAIEFLEGESLRDRIARGPLDTAGILHIGIDVCAALEAAHAGGIIHRDIKPANIFLTIRGGTKVLDFGAAKRVSAGLIDPPAVPGTSTAHSMAIGTLAYMSPEQGSGLPTDARSDVYSLGAVLYEMATGRLPADADQAYGSGAGCHLRDLEALVGLEPALPAALSAVIAKALEEDRSSRYQNIAEMRADLVALQRKRLGSNSFIRIPVLAAGLAALIAAALVAISVGSSWRSHGKASNSLANERPIRSLAVLPFRNSTGDPSIDYFADGMTEALIDDLSSLGTIRIVSSNSSSQSGNRPCPSWTSRAS